MSTGRSVPIVDDELVRTARRVWKPSNVGARMAGGNPMQRVGELVQRSTGAKAWLGVLAEITRENDHRRTKDPDAEIYWTWEQWDRFIAAVEQARGDRDESSVVVTSLEVMRRRVRRAQKDGLSPWQFCLALKTISEMATPKSPTFMSVQSSHGKYQEILSEAVMRERARHEAREIVARERGMPVGGGTTRRKPAAPVEA